MAERPVVQPDPQAELPAVLSRSQVMQVVRQAGLPDLFVEVAFCESRYNRKAVNENKREDGSVWSRDRGLWQINDHYWTALFTQGDWTDPAFNAEMAKAVYSAQGLAAWNASRRCWDDAY